MKNNRLRRLDKIVIAIIAIAAATFAVGNVASAVIPDSAGVIHGCRNAFSGGSLRVIDSASQTCDSRSETALNWNQKGNPGVSGRVIVKANSASNTMDAKLVTANCPANTLALGGGGAITGGAAAVIRGSFPTGMTGNGWSVVAIETPRDTTNSWYLTAFAICAKVG